MNIFNRKTIDHFKSRASKDKPEWYISTYDVLSGIAKSNDVDSLKDIDNTLHGVLSKKEYNSFMNPFNFKEERHKNIPGKLRNYDIIVGNVRRFVGEYITSYQEFHVTSMLPDEDNEMLTAANELAYRLLSERAVNKIKAEMNDGEEEASADIPSQVEQFKSRWKDNRVINDFNMLEYVRAFTEDAYIYGKAYFHWIVYGRYFIEHRIYRNDVVKEVINPLEAYPIFNDKDFVEDYEGFLIERKKSLGQIIADHGDELEPKDKVYLREIEKTGLSGLTGSSENAGIIIGLYKMMDGLEGVGGDIENTDLFSANLSAVSVGTLYYKGWEKILILTYIDPLGNELEMEVEEGYEVNPMIGDIGVTEEWYPVTYKQMRFGSRTHGVYTKPVKLDVQRQMINNNAKVKLPITGKVGIFPGFPNHSLVKILFPFQVSINLLEMAKERAIVTAQGKIAIIPKELLGSNEMDQEEEMYNMLVMKKLLPTTANIPNLGSILNSIRDINLSDNEYINLLSELIVITKESAKDAIDMNRQREGNTYASDGKGAAEDSATRMSMGSAVINHVFDHSRCKDYEADIDFSKVAWVDGKKAKFVTTNRQQAFFEVNPIQHMETEYGINVTTAFDYDQQKKAIKDYAFSLGQNGVVNEDIILDVITNKNISKLKEILQVAKTARESKEEQRFQEEQATRKHESDNALEAAQMVDEKERYKIDQDNLTKLLVKEIDLTLKELDMEQSDKDNQVLENIQGLKQKLETQVNILHGK